MEPIVDLAPGAESSILAPYFAERVREGLRNPARRAVFSSLKATVFVVDFDSGQAVTLRFDHGRLTLHEGTIGRPSVTIGGPLRALLSLDRVRLGELPRALLGRDDGVGLVERGEGRASSPPPPPSGRQGRVGLRELAALFAAGELKIYGLYAHPRTVARFFRLISRG